MVVAAAVFSHFLLDVLVHVAGLPLLGPASPHVGLGLWRHTGVELAVECGLGVVGWWLYAGAPGSARAARRGGLAAAVAIAAVLTVWGSLTPAPPPPPAVMAVSSLAMIGGLTALAFWLERRPAPGRALRRDG
jgi:hypothetical protein